MQRRRRRRRRRDGELNRLCFGEEKKERDWKVGRRKKKQHSWGAGRKGSHASCAPGFVHGWPNRVVPVKHFVSAFHAPQRELPDGLLLHRFRAQRLLIHAPHQPFARSLRRRHCLFCFPLKCGTKSTTRAWAPAWASFALYNPGCDGLFLSEPDTLPFHSISIAISFLERWWASCALWQKSFSAASRRPALQIITARGSPRKTSYHLSVHHCISYRHFL